MRRFGKLEAISFITGFSLMAFELAAARILAPSIGSSTYVWTSVIGVIIAALSLGYWVGGRLADKRKAASDVVWLLMLAATTVVLALVSHPVVLEWAVQAASDSRVQAVVAATLLFAPASFLLGAVSPYLAKLNITSIETSGAKVASLSALNSVGGIAGTFVTGFILFGYIGSRETLGIVTVLLLLASWLLVRRYRRGQRLILSALLLLPVLLPVKPVAGVVDIDTPSAHYQIVQYDTEQGPVVGLVTGTGGVQSAVYQNGLREPVFWYIRELARQIIEQYPARILVLGGGAFTLPQYLAEALPASRVDVVEIDPELERISRQYFGYTQPDGVRLVFDDARAYVNTVTATYDAIVVDVYGDTSVPFSLMTQEFGQAIGKRITPGGRVYVNIAAGPTGACRELFSAIDIAYRSALPYGVYSSQFGKEEPRGNHIVTYTRQPIAITGTAPLEQLGGTRYTDNYMPAERLNFACQQST